MFCNFRYRRLALILSGWFALAANLGGRADEAKPQPYAAPIVEKAESILQQHGLRRSGKTLQSTNTVEINRELSQLSKLRRDLTLKQKAYAGLEQNLAQIEQQLQALNARDGQLNVQLAQVAGQDVAANNRIVATINALRTQVTALRSQRTAIRQSNAEEKTRLNESEAAYAEQVFQVRQKLNELRQQIDNALADEQVKIAIGVMHANFQVPKEVSTNQILDNLESRVAKFEQQVFQESIPLEKQSNGSLVAMVSVNNQPIEMVVDSGATLVVLPADAAAKLQIPIPADAPSIPLSLANGDQITGRRITLKTVRVGELQAEDVEAVVLDPIARRAAPLLGLSYLDRYKFELNPTGNSLKLLRVE